MGKKKSVHGKTIDEIVNRLITSGRKYIEIRKNYEYHNGRQGEIDLYAVYKSKRNKIYIKNFEIKCNDTYKARKKAKYQLNRSTKYLQQKYGYKARIFKIYSNKGPTYKLI